jgi:hypothetical protein
MSVIPSELNGYPVIRRATHTNCSTVMVERPGNRDQFVVATWWSGLGSTWSWGHYCKDLVEANKEFSAVQASNERR